MYRRFLFWKVWLQRSCSSLAALLVTISPSLLLALSAAADLVLFNYVKSLVLTHLLKPRKKIGAPERSGASASQHGHFVLPPLVWCSPRDLPLEVLHLLWCLSLPSHLGAAGLEMVEKQCKLRS